MSKSTSRSKVTLITTICFFMAVIFLVAKAQFTKQDKQLLAGAAIENITPIDSKLIEGKKIHDSLYARTLILDDGNNRVAFIVVDNQGLPGYLIDETKTKISRESGIEPMNIMISSTHSHSTIFAGQPINLRKDDNPFDDYQKLLIENISKSVKNAITNLEPAKIGWDSFEKPEHVFNRRWYTKELTMNPFGTLDSVKTNPGFSNINNLVKPAGPVDPEVAFMAVKSLSEQPIAVFANYSLHYVGVPENSISADYYGEFANQLTKNLGGMQTKGFVGIMSNGTSGDINNTDYNGKGKDTLTFYDKVDYVAHDLANEISKRLDDIEFRNWVPINASVNTTVLKLRRPTKQMSANIQRITQNKRSTSLYNNQEKQYALRANNFPKIFPKEVSIDVQAIAIGDLVIGAVPFEVFAETGLELKRKSPFKNTFIIGLANGHWGYLPPPEQHKKGGYETWFTVNRVQKDGSRIIERELLSLFNRLK